MPRCTLVVRGYAGTGKTTMVRSIVQALSHTGGRAVLLAPTGRAAKVLASYTGHRAGTIHRHIYVRRRTHDGRTFFALSQNMHRNTVFVVDEASMIGWDTYSGPMGGNLLEDLMAYVFNGSGCRLLLIGDGAQLPPVGSAMSPALELSFLTGHFDITAATCTLTHVTRQREDSGILALATALRSALPSTSTGEETLPEGTFPFELPLLPDVETINGADLQDVLESAFAKCGPEGVTLITRSNKRANLFNKEIRARVYYRDDVISGGDLIMCVKNSYYWLDADSKAGFIANGDIMEVLRVGRSVHQYGFDFVHATVRLVDYSDEPDLDVVLWLNALDSESPAMDEASQSRLYRAATEHYAHLSSDERRKALQSDPYYQALQVKFAWAVTCHKAQGGQWPVVFVDQGFLTEDMLDLSYLRWLYTAVTRATEKLYLLNFGPQVFCIP
jgi:exodeoxyribonuclease-5